MQSSQSGRLSIRDLPEHLRNRDWQVPAMQLMRANAPGAAKYTPYNILPDSKIIASCGPITASNEDTEEREGTVEFLLKTVMDKAHPVSHIYVVATDVVNYAIRKENCVEKYNHRYEVTITQAEESRGFSEASLQIARLNAEKHSSNCQVTVFNEEWMKILADSKSPEQKPLQDKILQAYRESCRDTDEFILIHCQAGISRTAHLAFILVLMKHLEGNPGYANTLQEEMKKGADAKVSAALEPAMKLYNEKMRSVRRFEMFSHEFLMCVYHASTLNSLRLNLVKDAKANPGPAMVTTEPATKNPAPAVSPATAGAFSPRNAMRVVASEQPSAVPSSLRPSGTN